MHRLVFPLITSCSSNAVLSATGSRASRRVLLQATTAALSTPTRGQYYNSNNNSHHNGPYPPAQAQRAAPSMMGGGGMMMGSHAVPPELRAPPSSSSSSMPRGGPGGYPRGGTSAGGPPSPTAAYPPSSAPYGAAPTHPGGRGPEGVEPPHYSSRAMPEGNGPHSAAPPSATNMNRRMGREEPHSRAASMSGGDAALPAEEESFQPPQKPSESPKFITITEDEGGKRGIYTVSLSRPPVNSLHLDLLEELNSWMLWLGSTEEVKAVILTSVIPTVFSAGLDLQELHRPQQERFIAFWTAFQETWIILNSFPHPIVAAITGNSPSAGCTLAMGCDYRVMARGPRNGASQPIPSSSSAGGAAPAAPPSRPYRIGLNECKLGLVAPAWAMPAYGYLLGSRRAERMLQLGETPTAEEALQLGLIDQIVESDDRVMEAAVRMAERFAAIPKPSRWMARNTMRQEYLDMLASEENRHYDTEFFSNLIGSPEVQGSLEAYLERFKQLSRK